MTISDITLLGKKILVGIVLVIIPLLILWLLIRFSLYLANADQPANSSPVSINSISSL
jgi:hypothetical protein